MYSDEERKKNQILMRTVMKKWMFHEERQCDYNAMKSHKRGLKQLPVKKDAKKSNKRSAKRHLN